MTGQPVLTTDGIDSLLTVQDAATLCGVSVKTIYTWKSRKGLKPAGLDSRKRELFRLLDLAKIERSTRRLARR